MNDLHSGDGPVFFRAQRGYSRNVSPHSVCAYLKDKTTAKNPGKAAAKGDDKNERLIAQNRKARHNYEVLDTLECGVMLTGSEVKSLRAGQISLEEAYGRMDKGE